MHIPTYPFRRPAVRAILGLMALTVFQMPVEAETPREEAAKLLKQAQAEVDASSSVQGKFTYTKDGRSGDTQVFSGTFRVQRRAKLPPLFDIILEEEDRKSKRRVWSDGENVYSQEGTKPARSCSVYRGGIQFLQQDGLSIGSPYIQMGFFEKLLAYRPGMGTDSQETRDLLVSAPQMQWTYRFDRGRAELLTSVVENKQEGSEETVTIEYRDVQVDSGNEWKLDTALGDSVLAGGGPYDSLLGVDCSAAQLKWELEKSGTLADLHGKIVVIDFWASWCAPCMQEMPGFKELSTRYDDEQVQFICAPWNESEDRAKAAAKRGGFQHLLHGVAAELFQLDEIGIPCQFVLGTDGRILDFIVGSHGAAGKEHLQKIIDEHL